MHYNNVWQKWNWTKFKESQNVVHQKWILHKKFQKITKTFVTAIMASS